MTIHLEELFGAPVHDRDGKKLGHIFEMRAELQGDRYAVVEYLLGSGALLERIHMSIRGLFGIKQKEPRRIRWDELDLTDLKRPVYVGTQQK